MCNSYRKQERQAPSFPPHTAHHYANGSSQQQHISEVPLNFAQTGTSYLRINRESPSSSLQLGKNAHFKSGLNTSFPMPLSASRRS